MQLFKESSYLLPETCRESQGARNDKAEALESFGLAVIVR